MIRKLAIKVTKGQIGDGTMCIKYFKKFYSCSEFYIFMKSTHNAANFGGYATILKGCVIIMGSSGAIKLYVAGLVWYF